MSRTCEVDGCSRPHLAKGLCAMHYKRARQEAMQSLSCSVEGCTTPPHQMDMCHSHYWRMYTHGDPLAGGTPMGERLEWLRQVISDADPQPCILHPFGSDTAGYGQVILDGRRLRMHQAVLLLTGRELPAKGMHTRHLCGTPGCVNPHHLLVGTPAENGQDSVRHGTARGAPRGELNPEAKLTEADVRLIRAHRRPDREWAEHFGVSLSTVNHARLGRTWKHVR